MRIVCSAVVVGTLVTLSAAQAMAQGTASGTFTVNKKPASLTHVYATPDPDEPGAVQIVVSNVAVTAAQAADPFALQKMMNDGQLHAIVFIVSADKQVTTTQLYDKGFKMDSASVAGSNYQFDATRMTAKAIAGKFFTKKPDDFDHVPFEFSVTFDTPISAAPVAPGTSGALDGPQAKAVLAYYAASRKGDRAALKQTITAEAGKELDGPQGAQAVEMLKAMAPAAPKITSVRINGDKAVVEVVSTDGATTTKEKVTVVKVGTAWKVDPNA